MANPNAIGDFWECGLHPSTYIKDIPNFIKHLCSFSE